MTTIGAAAKETGKDDASPAYTNTMLFGLVAGPALGLLLYALIPGDSLGYEGRAVLAATAVMAVYWITEALPLPATALIPLFLLPIIGAAPIDAIAPAYANPVIFMYMGGFVLALAIEK
ncbi:hypothetical protein [Aureimonas sp. SK2]|uniref:hypothetical protein n=1 Tax=Aureimonas sp. SK2 TaxID=3015992 RepID=UPI003261C5B8